MLYKKLSLILATILIAAVQFSFAQETEEPSMELFTNVNVWDGTSDQLATGTDVLVVGNKISKIGKGLSEDGAQVVDGNGGTLIPGLLDMHQHLLLHGGTAAGTYDWDAYIQGAQAYKMMQKFLYMGYTTIREIGGNSISLSRAVRSGYIDGPRIYTSGPVISQTGGHGDWR